MSDLEAETGPRPVVPYLKFSEDGEPYLAGSVCAGCETTFVGEREVCSRCGARDRMHAVELSNQGTLYAYSIVHRSFPGVSVPYISAIVDLSGGGCVKGNLIDMPADPDALEFGMPVEVVYGDAGRKDAEGNRYVSYFFRPISDGGRQAR